MGKAILTALSAAIAMAMPAVPAEATASTGAAPSPVTDCAANMIVEIDREAFAQDVRMGRPPLPAE